MKGRYVTVNILKLSLLYFHLGIKLFPWQSLLSYWICSPLNLASFAQLKTSNLPSKESTTPWSKEKFPMHMTPLLSTLMRYTNSMGFDSIINYKLQFYIVRLYKNSSNVIVVKTIIYTYPSWWSSFRYWSRYLPARRSLYCTYEYQGWVQL